MTTRVRRTLRVLSLRCSARSAEPRRARPQRRGLHPSRLAALAPQDEDNRQATAFSRCVFDSHPSYQHTAPTNLTASDLCQMPPAVEGRNHHDRGTARKPKTKERKGSRTPKGASRSSALARRGARPSGRARLPAFHGGSHQRDSRIPTAQLWARLHETSTRRWRGYPARRRTHLQRCTSRAGHSAGRHDALSPRERQ